MQVNNMPRTAILQLAGNDVRIHLTRTLLVVVQNSPPTQLACLNLRNLNAVESGEGVLTFEASARSWLKPHTFSFLGEHTAQISRALRLLLRPDQFLLNRSGSIQTNNSILQQPHVMIDTNLHQRERHHSQNVDFITNSMPLLHSHQRSATPTAITTPAQTLPLPPRRGRWMQEPPGLHHYVNTSTVCS